MSNGRIEDNHGRDAGAGAKCGEGLFQVLGLDLAAGWLFACGKSGAQRWLGESAQGVTVSGFSA
jgi:hypothetical protein